MATTTAFIESLYESILYRASDEMGLAYWEAKLDTGELTITELTNCFINSQEFETSIAPIANLYYITFGRAPDMDGLRHWIDTNKAGMPLDQIASCFLTCDEYASSPLLSMSNEDFVEALYANGFGRTSDVNGKASWVQELAHGASKADILVSFATSAEEQLLHGFDIRTMALHIALTHNEATTDELNSSATLEEIINSLYNSAKYSGVDVPGATGIVSDGYISGATVFADANGDGIWNEGEAKTTTDANGDYTLVGGTGSIVAFGGTDISTGVVFEGIFTAPVGSTTVSALTTLVNQVVKATLSDVTPITVAEAEAKVKAALGLSSDINLLTFDPIAVALDSTLSAQSKAAAITTQAIAVQITNMISQSASMLSGAGITNEASGSSSAAAALAHIIINSSTTDTPSAPLSLTSANTIKAFLEASASEAGASTQQATSVAVVSSSIATATANINSVMADTVIKAGSEASAASIFADLAHVQLAAENIENLVKTATSSGSTAAVHVASDTASIITASEKAAETGGIPETPHVDTTPAPELVALVVSTTAGSKVNEILLHVTSQPKANVDKVTLSFGDLPDGTTVLDALNNDVTAGIDDYNGTNVFTIVLPVDYDTSFDLAVTTTNLDAYEVVIDTNLQTIKLAYDVNSLTQDLTFASNNQNMWGNFPGSIGWHEYIPLIGGAPIVWDAQSEEWTDVEGDTYWRSGEFNVIDIELSSTEILDAVSAAANSFLDAAKEVFDTTAFAVDTVAKATFDEAKTVFQAAEDAFFYGAHVVDTAVLNAFQTAKEIYDAGLKVYQDASYVFNTVATGLHNKAYSDWVGYNNWYNSLDGWGQFWNLAGKAVVDSVWAAADISYSVATGVWNAASNEFNNVVKAAYNIALDTYNAAAGAIDAAAQATFDAAQATLDSAEAVYNAVAKKIYDDALSVFNTVQDGVLTTIATIGDAVSFDSKLQLEANTFAQIGLQVDFELDMGSVDTSIDYELTSLTQYNQTTDTLVITPTMTNMTTGSTVAFETISPNIKFYAALLYDVGADLNLLVDGNLVINGTTIYDFSPGTEASTIPLTVSTNDLTDILGVTSGGNIDVGTLVLVDLDSTQLEPYEVPFLEDLSKGILTLEFALPTVETEGTADTYTADTFKEGDLLTVDFSEISSTFFNIINAKIDFSDELKAQYGLDSLDDKTIAEMVTDAITAVMATVWDVVDGQSEGVPILVIDTTDEDNTSLVHLNLFPDSIMTDTTTENTGSLGFYAAYGESDPVIKFQVDIDAAAALVVNEVLKAAAAIASGGTSASFDDAIPLINPLDIEFGIEQVLKMALIPKEQIDEITKFINLGFEFEAADLDAMAEANFSQAFTLSIDDMSFLLTLEDGTKSVFTAKDAGSALIQNASSHDLNKDGSVSYSLNIVPTAMFSNDTEIGLSLGYSLEFLKGSFVAGAQLPLGTLIGGENGPDWLNIEIPGIDIGIGPLLSITGDFDALSVDVFESRFAFNVGSDETEIETVGINDSTMFVA